MDENNMIFSLNDTESNKDLEKEFSGDKKKKLIIASVLILCILLILIVILILIS